jgi:hypothetical protein
MTEKQYITFHIPDASAGIRVRMLFNENHDPENGQFCEGGGSVGGVKGVTYKYSKINAGAGELHPLVSKSGISAMKSDFEKAGMSNYPLTKATDEQLSQMVGQMNNDWTPDNRGAALTKLAKAHLTKIGTPDADPEEHLNKWGMSGQTRMWHK